MSTEPELPCEGNSPQETLAERHGRVERDVLYLLTGEHESQPLWFVLDLGRELRNMAETEVAVDGLQRAGLIYKTSDGFVFASRAGSRAAHLVGHIL
jgi:hypothetical protein